MLRQLAEHVKRGRLESGGTPMEFNTVAISDGITMGRRHEDSLVSREVIADSIELMAAATCSTPMVRPAWLRQDDPGGVLACSAWTSRLIVYGGSIQPGLFRASASPC